ncbi:MAG: hypothetical protein ACTHOB_18690 [Ginsengibacter sp.]
MGNKKVVIIGPVAPPFGGVSVHILRLSQLLKSHFDFDFIDESRTKKSEYFNLRSFNLLKYFNKVKSADLLYINSGKTSLRIFHLLIGKLFAKKMILTIHSFPKTPESVKRPINRIYNLADQIMIVNEQLKTNLILPENKHVVKEAFIPPVENETELLPYISDWLHEKKDKGNTIICANASSLEMYNNEDVYGLDLCISVFDRLRKKNIGVSFIFVVSSIEKNDEKFFEYKNELSRLKLDNEFLLVHERLSFVRVIEMSDIVVRSTNTDGDALTVREGLFLKKPVLTSDVVKRPDGVILFKNRNIDDLELKLENLIHEKSCGNFQYEYLSQLNDTSKFYIDLIETVLAK